ncbi:DNA-binding protein WhiA [Sulfoacidibacillus thermotolerans]|uniref:Probable cell division protein WhiA n=1 Tax=Sulfoacidibacillus thermotolerans TaxID=1765684 RepID=A0A2U3D8S6_SULT2|nr:DNA-binding protein WhiA [Sulfoacidibacillus thermotolerans]PWI57675.1 DNA-binding protein WhiA [Sulfoacidibacillus thermotolerans]
MSFAAQTKKELTQLQSKPCCERAELTGFIQHCGRMNTDIDPPVLELATENAAIARRMYQLLKAKTGVELEVLVQRKMRLKKNNVYIVRMRQDVSAVFDELQVGDAHEHIAAEIPTFVRSNTCCKKAYLRGAFLASGSVNDPDSHSYHLEIYCKTQEHAQELLSLFTGFHLHAKVTRRKKGYIVYLKEGDKIVEFLGMVGAHQALLRFEEVRIVKEMRNQVNRLVNCETANLNKTILAAVRQLDNIRLIERELGFARLPQKLRVVAEKRLQYPDITLQELCEVLPDKVSKSGLNHRLRKLDDIAQKIRADRGIFEES